MATYLTDILKYSIQNTYAFRAYKRDIRALCDGDQSLVNIYKAIQFFADHPDNRNIQSIPLEIIRDQVSKSNKYIEGVLDFSTDSRIVNYDTFKTTLQRALDDYKSNKITEIAATLGTDYADNKVDSLRDKLKQIGLIANATISSVPAHEVVSNLEEYYRQAKGSTVSTGYYILDYISDGGYRKGQIWNFGGRSGIGKTWLSCNLSLNLINFSPVFLSNEMTRNEIMTRLLAIKTQTSEWQVEKDGLNGKNKPIAQALSEKMAIYELCHTVEVIEAIVDFETGERGKSIFILDHFHNMYGKKFSEGENQAHIAHELQRIAQQYQITFIVMHQVSKSDYKTDGAEATFKGRGDSIETCNYGFILSLQEDKQIKIPEVREYYKVFTVAPIKIRRGKKQVFYLEQNFQKGGYIYEPTEVAEKYKSYFPQE